MTEGYEKVHGRGCNNYIHMDWEMNGINGGEYSLDKCAAAVKALDGQKGCNGKFFFYETAGYCNCPTDDCTTSPNGNAGGPGQLYKFIEGRWAKRERAVLISFACDGVTCMHWFLTQLLAGY